MIVNNLNFNAAWKSALLNVFFFYVFEGTIVLWIYSMPTFLSLSLSRLEYLVHSTTGWVPGTSTSTWYEGRDAKVHCRACPVVLHRRHFRLYQYKYSSTSSLHPSIDSDDLTGDKRKNKEWNTINIYK